MEKMKLRECHADFSYYYPKLKCEMKRIAEQNLDGHGTKAIEAFCSGVHGDLQLNSTEDYRNILEVFKCFVAGVAWALKHYPANSRVTPPASIETPASEVT